jgi:SAM-dependent methyltransferase
MPEDTSTGDRAVERSPTKHEQQSGQPWDASYTDGPAPWDVGHAQPAVVRAAARGAFRGRVLDAGCGSGVHALHLAALGLPVVGVDVAATALRLAREQATAQGLPTESVEFVEADALQLERLGRRFDSVLDCGLFHALDEEERRRYVAGLAAVTEPGADLTVLCFRDDGADAGPHPVAEADLRRAFGPGSGWAISSLEAERIETRYHERGAPAWLATVRRR